MAAGVAAHVVRPARDGGAPRRRTRARAGSQVRARSSSICATWASFSRYGKDLDNDLNRLAWKDTVPLLAADPATLDRARYTTFADFLVKRGLIKQAPPLDSYLREIK